MADTDQSLREFTQNLLSDIQSGSITTDEAIAACGQYSYLRDLLESERTKLSAAELAGPEEFMKEFSGVLTGALDSLRDLPNFQSQLPEAPLDETRIRTTGALRTHAVERVKKSTHPETPSYREQRREFIHDIVSRYSARVNGLREDTIGSALDRSFTDAAASGDQTTRERLADHIVATVVAGGNTIPARDAADLTLDIQNSLRAHGALFTEGSSAARRAATIEEELFTHPGMKRPDVFVDVVINAPQDEPIDDSILRASRLADTAAFLEEHNGEGGKRIFFSHENARGAARGLAAGADGILGILGDPARDMIYHQKVNGVFGGMLANTQIFMDRLGEGFVHSSLFSSISQNLSKQLSEKRTTGGVGSLFGDVFSTVFRGPLDPVLSASAKDRLLDYFELARADAAAPKGHGFMPQGILPWDVFRAYPDAGRPGSSRGLFGRMFPLFGLAPLAAFLGSAFSAVVDKTTSFLFSSPSISQEMSRSRQAADMPTPLREDMPRMVSLVVIITILLLFVIPSPFNTSEKMTSSKSSALFASLVKIVKTYVGNILCTGECMWPTTGPITQGPNTSSAASHRKGGVIAESIDIGATCGTPVISTMENGATVASIYNECTDNTGEPGDKCGGGWGNYVIIEGSINTGSGSKKLSLRYSHLSQGSMPPDGATINRGQQIGEVDHNGNSEGCHLHYEVVGGSPPINSILPYEVPSCVGKADCCGQMGSQCNVSP